MLNDYQVGRPIMKIDPRRLLVGAAVAATLLIAPPAAVYALGAVDPGLSSLPRDAETRPDWMFATESLTDARLDDNDNAVDNDNGDAADNDNGDAADNDNDANTDPAPAGGVDPNPNNNDPNNNGDSQGGNNGAGSENGGGGNDSSSGVSGDVGN
jgi:hypothetical protein